MVALTRTGLWLLLGGCAALLLGVAVEAAEWLVWSVLSWGLLGMSYLRQLRVLDALERGDIVVRIVGSDGGTAAACLRGQDLDVRIVVENRSPHALRNAVLTVVDRAGLRVVEQAAAFGLRSAWTHQLAAALQASRSGRWTLRALDVHSVDLLGLFSLRTRLRVDFAVTVIPNTDFVLPSRGERGRAIVPIPDAGPEPFSARGEGNELREIRPYVSSDAFSRIAWKASARTGQLMVREHEDEIPGVTICVLDASSTMRGGEGALRLEYAFSVASSVFEQARRARDRSGLVAFDDTVVGRLAPGSGQAHRNRLNAQVVALATIPSPGLDEGDEDAVYLAVARWARATLRLDFRTREARGRVLAPDGEGLDHELMRHWIATRRGDEVRAMRRELLGCGVDASTWSDGRLLAGIEGIALGVRTSPRLGSKDLPLAGALGEGAAMARDPARIVVVTDLAAVLDPGPVVAAVAAARERGHAVAFVVPFVPAFEAAEAEQGDPLRDPLHAGFAWAEREERARIVRALRNAGAGVLVVGPQVAPAAALASASSLAAGLRRRRR